MVHRVLLCSAPAKEVHVGEEGPPLNQMSHYSARVCVCVRTHLHGGKAETKTIQFPKEST